MKLVTCLISQPDNRVFHVEVDSKCTAQECMDKICKILGIMEEEQDYFGLQFTGQKNELLWLNMRNKLTKQIPGSSPYHLNMRVKFFVEPHMLLQEETRYQFYLDVRRHLVDGIWDSGGIPESTQCELIALMTQADYGDFNLDSSPCKYACFWPDSRDTEIPAAVIRRTAARHRELRGLSASRMQYLALQQVTLALPMYGVFFYECKSCYDERLLLGIGPDVIFECDAKDRRVRERYRFCQIQKVQVSDRIFFLSILNMDATTREYGYRMVTRTAANALYRCVTEMHAFYRCDTVHEEVVTQTNRDLRGTLVALFIDHDNSEHHKDYVFDIRRTSREVYDTARRRLHSCSSEVSAQELQSADDLEVSSFSSDDEDMGSDSQRERHNSTHGGQSSPLEEASQCRVCMDKCIACAFIPCGHLVCCDDCAKEVTTCPVCRADISERQRIYLPWATTTDLDNVFQNGGSSSLTVPSSSSSVSDLAYSSETLIAQDDICSL